MVQYTGGKEDQGYEEPAMPPVPPLPTPDQGRPNPAGSDVVPEPVQPPEGWTDPHLREQFHPTTVDIPGQPDGGINRAQRENVAGWQMIPEGHPDQHTPL